MGQAGDGYQDNPTPHTVKEEFLGVNVNNATWVSMCPHANAIDLLFYLWSILIRWFKGYGFNASIFRCSHIGEWNIARQLMIL